MRYSFSPVSQSEHKSRHERVEEISLKGDTFWLSKRNSAGDRVFNVTALFLAIAEINLKSLRLIYPEPFALDSTCEEDDQFFDPITYKIIKEPVYIKPDISSDGEPTQYYEASTLGEVLLSMCGRSPLTKRKVTEDDVIPAPKSFVNKLKHFTQVRESRHLRGGGSCVRGYAVAWEFCRSRSR